MAAEAAIFRKKRRGSAAGCIDGLCSLRAGGREKVLPTTLIVPPLAGGRWYAVPKGGSPRSRKVRRFDPAGSPPPRGESCHLTSRGASGVRGLPSRLPLHLMVCHLPADLYSLTYCSYQDPSLLWRPCRGSPRQPKLAPSLPIKGPSYCRLTDPG